MARIEHALDATQIAARITVLEARVHQLELIRKKAWSDLLYQNYLNWRAKVAGNKESPC